jgi:hypothetical protein
MRRYRGHTVRLRRFRSVIIGFWTAALVAAFGGGFVLAGCGGENAAPPGATTTDTTGTGPTTETGDTNGESTETEDTNGETTETADTNGGPTTAALTFALDLEGPVPFADRYSVTFSIDGTEDVHGFCGFGDASTRCRSSKLYTLEIPKVRVGAKLDWHFTRTGVTTFDFAESQNVTFSSGMTIAVRCTYRGTTADRPTCERTS